MSKPTMLLTGATGVLGRAFIEELAADHHLIALRHRTAVDDPRVEELAGSLTDEHLGLGAQGFRDLARRTDVVLHSAARTGWASTREQLFAANVTGTEHMLALARQADVPFHFVSTAFVARPQSEEKREIGPAAYVDSKVAAEQVVRDSGQPVVIVRPSVVSGHSKTGEISSFQGLHKVISSVILGTVPVLPAGPESPIDTVPQDVVAEAVGRLVRRGTTSGEFWLTAGRQSLTLGECVEQALLAAERYGMPPEHPPRLMPTEALDRLILPLMEDSMPRVLRQQFRGFVELMMLFQVASTMESSFAELGMADAVSHDRLVEAFARASDFWITSKMPEREAVA
ncbi:SDR family oxidoreductase [Kitasatospora sp. NPDC093806]|uniref:SDR family oxidoreductase n=1 Tax=Kitasatospora sp. NPDC093806 TaxID=3155075 RepID=UPI0034165B16